MSFCHDRSVQSKTVYINTSPASPASPAPNKII